MRKSEANLMFIAINGGLANSHLETWDFVHHLGQTTTSIINSEQIVLRLLYKCHSKSQFTLPVYGAILAYVLDRLTCTLNLTR